MRTVLKNRGLYVINSVDIGLMNKHEEQTVKEQFGAKLRSVRQEKGFSQEALALACRLDRSYVGGVERGERNVSLVNIQKIARALGVSAKEFF